MNETLHRDPMQEFADRIIGELEKGVKPWERPWDPEKAGGPQAPFNPVTGKRYHGVNVLKAIDRAMEIARHLSKHPPESAAYIKRLVRSANETPLADGLALERNLFLRLCTSDTALARMRSYEEKKIPSPLMGLRLMKRS